MEAAAGVAPIVHYREVAFMGIVSVVKNLGKLTRIGRQIQAAMRDFAPDVVIPVDYADFNFRFILPYAKRELTLPRHLLYPPQALGVESRAHTPAPPLCRPRAEYPALRDELLQRPRSPHRRI